jgi:hypothetical protein
LNRHSASPSGSTPRGRRGNRSEWRHLACLKTILPNFVRRISPAKRVVESGRVQAGEPLLPKRLPGLQSILGMQFADCDGPALSFDWHAYGVPGVEGRRAKRQAEFPAGRGIRRHRNDNGRVGDVDANLGDIWAAPAQGIQQRQRQRATARRVYDKISIAYNGRLSVGAEPHGRRSGRRRRKSPQPGNRVEAARSAMPQRAGSGHARSTAGMRRVSIGRSHAAGEHRCPAARAGHLAQPRPEPLRRRSGHPGSRIDLSKGFQPSREQTVGVPVLGRADT